ncbi:MAG: tRNA lysidine(34) synthetase TilS [Clostridiales bacterium GWF2_38_85]|nr:MAG: tRNA lysidine(34) synthetase TilS [Clostridiales bacterium GWF2_38_85]HBL84103.1 tRNA lysidine(34) synthetase TilS [Clostridiales bacterium]
MLKNKTKFFFEKKLYENITNCNLIEPDQTVIFGLSGGVDSVSLLYALNEISKKYPFKIIALHVNHGIRENAVRDEEFSRSFAQSLGVKFISEKIYIPKAAEELKQGIEETARQFRYILFEQAAEKYNADKIITAHNKNDNAETVLLNIIRGAGLNGICGIALTRGKIIRPMLIYTRAEIEEYAHFCDLSYVVDETNLDIEYTRNYIRHEIIPLLEKQNSNTIENICNLSKLAKRDIDLLNGISHSDVIINDKLPPSILSRRIITQFSKHSDRTLSNKHIEAIMNTIYSAKSAIISLPDNLQAVIDKISFLITGEIQQIEEPWSFVLKQGENRYNNIEIILSTDKIKITEIIYNLSIQFVLDFDKIKGTIFARSRHSGDSFVCHSINRNVKKCFINKKIKKEVRDQIPVICDSEGIICVPYIGVADRVYNKNAERSIYLYISRNEVTDEER